MPFSLLSLTSSLFIFKTYVFNYPSDSRCIDVWMVNALNYDQEHTFYAKAAN